ncbi:transmembrane protein, putative [Bodo saltans]|uniref:Transmembrane protein, putative n=1 Tax=Bodo saltans TaxID=75058 RepID=A0A0S4JE70_BODSA|nr:transmembrane protein, putative [Bodo saltans]|eukprot:CUG87468.1 transmembrane protein, putative [Bodo saltans]
MMVTKPVAVESAQKISGTTRIRTRSTAIVTLVRKIGSKKNCVLQKLMDSSNSPHTNSTALIIKETTVVASVVVTVVAAAAVVVITVATTMLVDNNVGESLFRHQSMKY